MNTVTLQGEDFTLLHNTLCDLRRRAERKNSKALSKLVKQFEKSLRNAYDQDHNEDDRSRQYWEGVADQNNFAAVWSVDSPRDCNANIGVDIDELHYDGLSVKLSGPTWLDFYRAANDLIVMSGDRHHIFIEGWYRTRNRTWELSTGS